MSDTLLRSHLPLKPAVFHILLALLEGEAHGYGVIQRVRGQSEGLIRLRTGHFYRHLRRLIDEGLIEESGHKPPDDDRRRGAYYRLTGLGRRVLSAEGRRLGDLAAATARLSPADGRGSS